MREIVVLFAVALACVAQNETYGRYVPTNDGSRLFFPSADRLAGTNQSFRSKLFSWDAEHGVQLVYESPAEYVCCISITGDGSLAAFHVSTSDSPPEGKGVLLDLRSGQVEVVGRTAKISRNGRYLFTGDALIDRIAGTSRAVSTPVPVAFIGSDGSLLYKDLNSLHRIDPDGTDRTVMNELRSGRLIDTDDNATTAIVSRAPGALVVVDTITGRQLDLGPEVGANNTGLLSGDGRSVVFQPLSPRSPPILCRVDASGCKMLISPAMATPVAISGDGSSVYTHSVNRRIVRIDTTKGQMEQAFAFAFFWPRVQAPFVPGSLARFNADNAGDHITVNGVDVPILSSSGGLMIQIPWDLTDQWVKFTMYGGESPFETFTPTYPVSDFFPQGFPPGSPAVNEGQPAYREDWSSTTFESPAVPGEIVHIYAVGLGAVDCFVETGRPAPLDRLCRATRMVDWRWNTGPNTTVPAEILFAGLAPGLVGLYQIDVRVPPHSGNEFIELSDGIRNFRVAFVRVRQR